MQLNTHLECVEPWSQSSGPFKEKESSIHASEYFHTPPAPKFIETKSQLAASYALKSIQQYHERTVHLEACLLSKPGNSAEPRWGCQDLFHKFCAKGQEPAL